MDPNHRNNFDLEDWLHYFDEVDPPLCWDQTLEKLDSIQVSPLLLREDKPPPAAASTDDVYGFELFSYLDDHIDQHYLSWWDWLEYGGLPSLQIIEDDDKNNVECHACASGKLAHSSITPTTGDVGATKNGHGGGGRPRAAGIKRAARLLELEEIEKYFELPIALAAKELKVGLTVLKKRCRQLNIKRWPHRKLKSLKSLIHNVKELGIINGEIKTLEEEKRMMEKAPEMELTYRTKKLRQACFKATYKKRIRMNPPMPSIMYHP